MGELTLTKNTGGVLLANFQSGEPNFLKDFEMKFTLK